MARASTASTLRYVFLATAFALLCASAVLADVMLNTIIEAHKLAERARGGRRQLKGHVPISPPGFCRGRPDNTACELDGNLCSGNRCFGGICVAGTAILCVKPLPPTGFDSRCSAFSSSARCNPETGQCEFTSSIRMYRNGTSCEADDNKCTTDKCYGGKCIKGKVKSCPPYRPPRVTNATQCLEYAGSNVCVPGTGKCEIISAVRKKADGTPCEFDGNKCTLDVCRNGACTPTNTPVVCPTLAPANPPPCYQVSQSTSCLPTSGCVAASSIAPLPDGSPCETDKNACTVRTCKAGKCVTNSTIDCAKGYPASRLQCSSRPTCDRATGKCLPPKPINEGKACNADNNKCTIDKCMDGECKTVAELRCPVPTNPCVLLDLTLCVPSKGCPASSAYKYKPVGSACDLDNNACTKDTCVRSGRTTTVCKPGANICSILPGH